MSDEIIFSCHLMSLLSLLSTEMLLSLANKS